MKGLLNYSYVCKMHAVADERQPMNHYRWLVSTSFNSDRPNYFVFLIISRMFMDPSNAYNYIKYASFDLNNNVKNMRFSK